MQVVAAGKEWSQQERQITSRGFEIPKDTAAKSWALSHIAKLVDLYQRMTDDKILVAEINWENLGVVLLSVEQLTNELQAKFKELSQEVPRKVKVLLGLVNYAAEILKQLSKMEKLLDRAIGGDLATQESIIEIHANLANLVKQKAELSAAAVSAGVVNAGSALQAPRLEAILEVTKAIFDAASVANKGKEVEALLMKNPLSLTRQQVDKIVNFAKHLYGVEQELLKPSVREQLGGDVLRKIETLLTPAIALRSQRHLWEGELIRLKAAPEGSFNFFPSVAAPAGPSEIRDIQSGVVDLLDDRVLVL